MAREDPAEIVALRARMAAVELRWRKHGGRRVTLEADVTCQQLFLDGGEKKLKSQEVPELKLVRALQESRAEMMAAIQKLAAHDAKAGEIAAEIETIRGELSRLRGIYGPDFGLADR